MVEIAQDHMQEIIDNVIENMPVGRLAYEDNNCNYLAWAVGQAGDGDHVEIGVMHGGSAIVAALVIRELGLKGVIYGVDPLDGYYTGTKHERKVDPISKAPINIDNVMRNAVYFGVEKNIMIIQQMSFPFPEQLMNNVFSSAYIDGDHWGFYPCLDWMNLRDRVNGYIVFDNYDDKHSDVKAVCESTQNHPNWEFVTQQGISYIVRRKCQK